MSNTDSENAGSINEAQSTEDTAVTNNFASFIGTVIPPPPSASYDASGSTTLNTVGDDTTTFSALA